MKSEYTLRIDSSKAQSTFKTTTIQERNIVMTGSDGKIVRQKMDKGAVEAVIFKPFKLEDLRRAVQGALASREREHGSVGSR